MCCFASKLVERRRVNRSPYFSVESTILSCKSTLSFSCTRRQLLYTRFGAVIRALCTIIEWSATLAKFIRSHCNYLGVSNPLSYVFASRCCTSIFYCSFLHAPHLPMPNPTTTYPAAVNWTFIITEQHRPIHHGQQQHQSHGVDPTHHQICPPSYPVLTPSPACLTSPNHHHHNNFNNRWNNSNNYYPHHNSRKC